VRLDQMKFTICNQCKVIAAMYTLPEGSSSHSSTIAIAICFSKIRQFKMLCHHKNNKVYIYYISDINILFILNIRFKNEL
jgi:hypothetical protein